MSSIMRRRNGLIECFVVVMGSAPVLRFGVATQPQHGTDPSRQLLATTKPPSIVSSASDFVPWRWADTKRASRHSREHDLDDFMNVALPQGLVASGFFANVVMQDFETRLRGAIGQVIDEALGIKLLDAAYYVDDFRLALQIPRSDPGLAEREVRDAISHWLQRQLDVTAPGLVVEQSKTTVTVEGRDRRFLVPQSRAAQRIQSDTSGVFDMLHGTELIGAIEGFFHTQKRYSTETKPEEVGRTGLLVGLSDMRDETAARFAAGRFRRTFRSLRPILEGDNQDVGQASPDTDEEPDDEASEHSLAVLTC